MKPCVIGAGYIGMADPFLLIDGRNCLDPQKVRAGGLQYQGIGRQI
jgi:hypothetical protein